MGRNTSIGCEVFQSKKSFYLVKENFMILCNDDEGDDEIQQNVQLGLSASTH